MQMKPKLYPADLGDNKTIFCTITNKMYRISEHLNVVDDLIHCCPWTSASGNSASGNPQHLRGDKF